MLLLCFISKSYSQNYDRWVFVTAEDNNDYSVYYDSETIKYTNNGVTMNLKFIYSDNSKEDWDKKFSILKWTLFCKNDSYEIVTGTIYYRNGEIQTYRINQIKEIIPDTIGETIYRKFCK